MKGTFASRPGQEIFNPYSNDSLLTNCCSVVCGPLPPRWLSCATALLWHWQPVNRAIATKTVLGCLYRHTLHTHCHEYHDEKKVLSLSEKAFITMNPPN